MKVDQYQEVEESAWKVLSPLLDGSTSLSHINGSVYSPEVPDIVLKRHANAINKVGLIQIMWISFFLTMNCM